MESIQNSEVAIVTGGSDGIGKEICKCVAKIFRTVIIACRNLEKGEAAKKEVIEASNNNDIRVLKLDLSSFQSVKDFVNEFKAFNIPLNLLINNGGIMMVPYSKTVDGYSLQMHTNHFGPSLLTMLLLEKLNTSQNPRVLMLSSKAHDRVSKVDMTKFEVQEKDYSPLGEYGLSKLCTLYFTQELQKKLTEKGSNIVLNSVHPGTVQTALFKEVNWVIKFFLKFVYNISVEDSGKACSRIAFGFDEDLQGVKGAYFDPHKIAKTSKLAQDQVSSSKVWAATCEILKVDPELNNLI